MFEYSGSYKSVGVQALSASDVLAAVTTHPFDRNWLEKSTHALRIPSASSLLSAYTGIVICIISISLFQWRQVGDRLCRCFHYTAVAQ